MKNNEETYILKRKIKSYFVSICFYILRVFPIKKRKVVFTAFEGNGGFCCNPRYIAENLIKENNSYELIWLVNDMKKEFPKEIKKVKNSFLNRCYHLSTSKFWIDNSRKEYGTKKRKSQYYIQTWHASIGFKPVGGYRGDKLPKIARIVSEEDSNLIDYVIANSKWCIDHNPKKLLYKGEIIKTGSPRCDIFTTKRTLLQESIRSRYNIPLDSKILLFAPTFQGGSQSGKREIFAEQPDIDFNELLNALENRFSGKWYVFLRMHPQLSAKLESMPTSYKIKEMIDVSQADDMNELITASDVLITDYSSSAFDAINMKIPIFIYATKSEEYINERGSLMWDMENFIFPFASTNEELSKYILNFDEDLYIENLNKFIEEQEILEDGKASERITEIINNLI